MKKIVTHPGTAHGDDFLACCILAAKFGVPIERHEPTADEINDPEIWVIDVGGKSDFDGNDEGLHNFDHHHNPNLECSFTQVCMALGIHMAFQRAYRWYDNVDFRDRRGMKALGEKYNLAEEHMLALGSPITTVMMTLFEKEKVIAPINPDWGGYNYKIWLAGTLYETMRRIGQELIDYAEKYGTSWSRLEGCERQNFRGHEIMINLSDDITATGDFAREHKISVMASHDNRGSGWAILRCSDGEKSFDFSRIANNPHVAFAHKGGFIAKTKERLTVNQVFDLIEQAII